MSGAFAGDALGLDLKEGLSPVEMESQVNQARRQLAELMRLRLMQQSPGQPEVAFEG